MDTEDTVVYLAVKDTNKITDNAFGINFSELLTDTDIGRLETWNSIGAALTQALVMGYSARIPGYVTGTDQPKRSLTTWSLMSVFKTFDLSYSDHKSDRADIPALAWGLNDLRIRVNHEARATPNLANCLPIVNGIACRPHFNKKRDALYALGGTRYMRNSFLPEIQLLDFSALGPIEQERLTWVEYREAISLPQTTSVISRGENDQLVLNRAWSCYTSKDLTKYTPLVVLGGSIIWPDEIIIDSPHTFRFRLFNRNLNRIRVWSNYCQDEPETGSYISYRADQILPYFRTEFEKPEESPSTECFVIYVRSSNLVVNRVPLRTWRGGLLVDHFAPEGVLVRDYTHSVHTYFSNTLTDRKVLRVQMPENLYFDSIEDEATEVLYTEYDCPHADLLRLCDSSYTMVYLLS